MLKNIYVHSGSLQPLFTIARIWKQLKCPSMDKENVIYIEYYLDNKLIIFVVYVHYKHINILNYSIYYMQ